MPIDRSRIPRTTRVLPRWSWHGLILVLAACGANKPTAQLDRAASWAATTRELAIERSLGSVGRHYTVQLLRAGRKDVRTIARSLDYAALPAGVRDRVPATLAQLDTIMTRTAESVDRGDLVGLGANGAAADALGDTLQTLRKAAGP
jgi:hypothetical protein